MAKYKAPYKNNTIQGMAWNAEAYRQHVNKEVADAAINAYNNTTDAMYDAAVKVWEVSNDIYNTANNAIDATTNFFTWEAEANKPTAWKMPTASVIHVDNPYKKWETQTQVQQWQATIQQVPQTSGRSSTWQNGWWTWVTTANNTNQTPTFSSKEDVVYYLAQQPWWNSLTEEQRVAKVEELWNRQNASTWETTQAQEETITNSLWDWYADRVMQNMQSDFQTISNDTIYGKTTWDTSTAITPSQDANSAYNTDFQSRMARVQEMISMSPQWIAYSLAWWDNAFSEQTIRDVKRYAPEFWSIVQAEQKKLEAEDVINAIASWSALPNLWQTATDNVNNWVNTWAEWISWTPQQTSYTIANAQTAMNNNLVANNATQLISSIDEQIEEYKSKIWNLRKEANSIFKWDVPDYVVNAYINNRSQQYQSEIEKLEWRRQSALDLYKIELSNYQRGVEMDLKYKQFNQDVNNENWDRWYKEQQLNKANIHWENWKAYQVNSDWTVTQLTDATAYNNYMTDVQNAINGYKALYTAWWWTKTATGYKYNVSGGQCQAFTNNFTERVTGLRMNWVYAKDKLSYMNEESWIPQVWDIAIAVWWVYDSIYWHTMLVTWYDPTTWIVDLLWSNNNGDELVYSTTDTLSNLYAKWLRGFWNPYKDMVETGVSNGTYWYNDQWILITPMTEKFDAYISQWVDTKSVASAERIYDTLYEISGNGELSALINSWDFWKMWAFVSKSQFADTKDDEWVTFRNSLNDYKNKYMAKEFTWWEQSINALNKLMSLVEAKLRKESWAVINSWEWRGAFELFLPRPWESVEMQWDKLAWWDKYIIELLRNWWLEKKTDYIPLFPKWQKRETW